MWRFRAYVLLQHLHTLWLFESTWAGRVGLNFLLTRGVSQNSVRISSCQFYDNGRLLITCAWDLFGPFPSVGHNCDWSRTNKDKEFSVFFVHSCLLWCSFWFFQKNCWICVNLLNVRVIIRVMMSHVTWFNSLHIPSISWILSGVLKMYNSQPQYWNHPLLNSTQIESSCWALWIHAWFQCSISKS